MITKEQLAEICPHLAANPALIDAYYPPMVRAMNEFEITNERRVAAFIAQMAHESVEFTQVVENLNYSAPRLLAVFPKRFAKNPKMAWAIARNPVRIGDFLYGGRNGNAPDEGFKFRGRTPTHLTFRSNYEECSSGIGVDIVTDPDVANRPDVMHRVAGWFWKMHGLNLLADRGQYDLITRRINGGTNGQDSRRRYHAKAKAVLGVA